MPSAKDRMFGWARDPRDGFTLKRDHKTEPKNPTDLTNPTVLEGLRRVLFSNAKKPGDGKK